MGRRRDLVGICALLALPLAFFLSTREAGRDWSWWGRSVAYVTYPVEWAVTRGIDGVAGGWRAYVALVGIREENDTLRAQVDRLAVQVHHLQEAARENERLLRLLGSKPEATPAEPLFARVVATAPSPLFRSLRIDRGSDDGVRLGAAVLGHGGVVGRIVAVGTTTADVMLLTDANSSADVLVGRSRVRVRVRGRGGDDGLAMDAQYLERTADVEPGDVLLTSGLGQTFPKGLLVGHIEAVERRAFGLYQRAQVQPAVDFSRLEEVFVLRPDATEGS